MNNLKQQRKLLILELRRTNDQKIQDEIKKEIDLIEEEMCEISPATPYF